MKLLILDNYDSFTYNLVHLVEKVSDISFDVITNSSISINEIDAYDKILLSPGPGLPSEAGVMPDLLKTYSASKSILGVCLGLQAIGESLGASLNNLDQVYHGLSLPVHIIAEDYLFENCPQQFNVGRYHSWIIDSDSLADKMIVTAIDKKNLIMAARHPHLDVRGVQFHPESILSEYGETMISNWLKHSLHKK